MQRTLAGVSVEIIPGLPQGVIMSPETWETIQRLAFTDYVELKPVDLGECDGWDG